MVFKDNIGCVIFIKVKIICQADNEVFKVIIVEIFC